MNSSIDELTSSRARPEASRVIILLTDGIENEGNANVCVSAYAYLFFNAAQAWRDNTTVYTIGFGDDVNQQELIDIALITGGKYYFAPDEATLRYIYQHIGQ